MTKQKGGESCIQLTWDNNSLEKLNPKIRNLNFNAYTKSKTKFQNYFSYHASLIIPHFLVGFPTQILVSKASY